MRTLDELFKTPRMFYAPLDANNSVQGLQDLLTVIAVPDWTIVELGSFAGVSSDLFARHFKKVFCVDIWNTKHQGIEATRITTAEQEFKKVLEAHTNITAISDDSIEAAENFADGSIDMVYIDTLHDYARTRDEIKAWAPKVKSGGWIAGHDYHMPGVKQAAGEAYTQIGGTRYLWSLDESWAFQKR